MSKLIDLTGQDFGYWHVLYRAENDKNGRARWHCICTACGTEKDVNGGHLRGGRSTNCGCIRKEKLRNASKKDQTDKIYGFLKVIREATSEQRPRQDRTGIYWNCTCLKCGRQNVIVFGDYLRNGDTKSCGCINSMNESKIAQILDNANIHYKTQYRFVNLTSTSRPCDQLMFDFAIFNQNNNTLLYLIEFDGSQHFSYFYSDTNKGWNNKEQFNITRKNDLLKNKYCFDNNIPLIRIPYDVDYTLQDLKLETTKFLLTQNNEQQYYNSRTKII